MEEVKIKQFLALNFGSGCGYGNGSGNGSGNGYCSGYGSGYGYCSGDGSGRGYGSGYCSGSGDGDGSGCGYGSGCGSGCGYGSGDGDDDGDDDDFSGANGLTIYNVDHVNTVFYSIHKNVAKGAIFNRDFTFTPCYIVKGNGYFAHGETIKKAMESLQNKIFENLDVEEKIAKFIEEFKLGKKYPAMKFYDWHNKLTGSCEMGRKSFAEDHDIDLDEDEFTVEEFIKITKNSYGGSVIQQLKDELGLQRGEHNRRIIKGVAINGFYNCIIGVGSIISTLCN